MSSHDNTQIMNIKGATSVKYSGQMPGGNSNFSLGGGYGGDDDRFGGKGQSNNTSAQANTSQAANNTTTNKDEEEKVEDCGDEPAAQQQ